MKYKSKEDIPLFVSAPQLAEILGISRAKAYELYHRSDFPVLMLGTRRMVCPRDKLLKWIEQNLSTVKEM